MDTRIDLIAPVLRTAFIIYHPYLLVVISSVQLIAFLQVDLLSFEDSVASIAIHDVEKCLFICKCV